MKVIKNKGINDIQGFKSLGIHSGVKKKKKDLCVIYSEEPTIAAATFTTNKVKAAPLLVNLEHIKSENIQAIVVNSGNANACTGEKGFENAMKMAETTAKHLDIKSNEVLVASTGVIGVPLPMNTIIPGIEKVCSLLKNGEMGYAEEAIMTTDSFPKQLTVETIIDGKTVALSGIAKGSGMIHPNMATMLSFVVTNVNISQELLSAALKDSVEDSYNMISVDGDTSTNDTVIALANGTAKNAQITEMDENYKKFKTALDYLNEELSKMIAKDGEGATKLIEVNISNAKSKLDAKLCAKSVISSSLVKTAFFGNDANWGRILCSLGYSSGEFSPEKVDVIFKSDGGEIQLVKKGVGLNFCESTAKKVLEKDHVSILIDLNDGNHAVKAWGCDLSYDYVKINGSYRS